MDRFLSKKRTSEEPSSVNEATLSGIKPPAKKEKEQTQSQI